MRYVSLFSGIEAASVAWEPLGWEPVAFSEIEPFCCDLLAQRYPNVPNLGDITEIDWGAYAGTIDLVGGGSPCQAFSVSGNRRGLMDARGRLMLEYVRAIRDIRPRWFVWENVPGVLSQSGGDAFETFQRELANLGYSLAWRTLDSQFYGVAQRRRRVFVVGHIGENARPAAVLFEPQSLFWDFATREQKRQSLTDGLRKGAQECIGFSAGQSAKAGSIAAQDELAPTLRASESGTNQIPSVCYTLKTGQTGANGSNISEDLAFTLDCSSPDVVAFQPQASVTQGVYLSDVSPTLDTSKIPAICMSDANTNAAINTELCGTLKVGGEPPIVVLNDQGGDRMTAEIEITGTLCAQTHGNNPIVTDGMVLRRITPVECERLQGFPDNWTKLNDDTKDTPRYKALGNSMAVPVMRWIGKRIQAVDEILGG